MYEVRSVEVTAALRVGRNDVEVRVHPLVDLLEQVPRRPRARWRTMLTDEPRLRWVRTTVLGRAPGFAPGPPVVGPYRPLVLRTRETVAVTSLSVRCSVDDGGDGVVDVVARVAGTAGAGVLRLEVSGPSGSVHLDAPVEDGVLRARLEVPAVARWWPHTHGTPALYDVRLRHEGTVLDLPGDGTVAPDVRRVGFRSLVDDAPDALALRVNGVAVFVRGAVWTPGDLAALDEAVALGLNLVRVSGISGYESDAFHARCDELGPAGLAGPRPGHLRLPARRRRLRRRRWRRRSTSRSTACTTTPRPSWSAARPSTSSRPRCSARRSRAGRPVSWPRCCGPSSRPRAPTSCGSPPRPRAGCRRPGSTSASRSTSASGPTCATCPTPGTPASASPRSAWRSATCPTGRAPTRASRATTGPTGTSPTSAATTWPPATASTRRSRTSSASPARSMADVLGEWRRPASPCAGGIVLWLRDLRPGAGWGLLDHEGRPKPAARVLAPVLAPTAVWIVDEGLNGLDVHVAHDLPDDLAVALRVELRRADGSVLESAETAWTLAGHAATGWSASRSSSADSPTSPGPTASAPRRTPASSPSCRPVAPSSGRPPGASPGPPPLRRLAGMTSTPPDSAAPRLAQTFEEVSDALQSRWPESRLEPSLDRIEALTELLGDPQRSYPALHLTGTNGKTSTSRMIDSLLRATDLRTGRFTSPHVEKVSERITVDGEPLDDEAFVRAFNDVAPYLDLVDAEQDHPVSFFETMVAMAYAAFAEAPVDAAVVEVGMGGRWDATNVAGRRGRRRAADRGRPRRLPRREPRGHRGREGRDHQGRRGRRQRPAGPRRARRAAGPRPRGRRHPAGRGHRLRRRLARAGRRRAAALAAGHPRPLRRGLPAAATAPTRPRTPSSRWPPSRPSSATGRSARTSSRRASPRSPRPAGSRSCGAAPRSSSTPPTTPTARAPRPPPSRTPSRSRR